MYMYFQSSAYMTFSAAFIDRAFLLYVPFSIGFHDTRLFQFSSFVSSHSSSSRLTFRIWPLAFANSYGSIFSPFLIQHPTARQFDPHLYFIFHFHTNNLQIYIFLQLSLPFLSSSPIYMRNLNISKTSQTLPRPKPDSCSFFLTLGLFLCSFFQ